MLDIVKPAMEWLDVDGIDVQPGRRAVDAARVDALVESIRAIGLQTPPTVRVVVEDDGESRFVLVAGAHRLEALRRLDVRSASFVVLGPETDAELWEIDENLCRNELTPAERAQLTARRKAIYERLHEVNTRGGDRKSNGQAGRLKAERFTADTARATGQGERTVRRDAARGEKVSGEAISLIRGTALDTGVFLDKLSNEPRDQQVAFVHRALADRQRQAEQSRDADDARRRNAKMNRTIAESDIARAADFLLKTLDADEAETLCGMLAGVTRPASDLALALRRAASM